jgi:hypothetical protein
MNQNLFRISARYMSTPQRIVCSDKVTKNFKEINNKTNVSKSSYSYMYKALINYGKLVNIKK